MSALTDPTVWLPGAVLTASLLGSAHCVGMCGALVTSVCRTRGETVAYHLGRGLAYGALGGLAGALGGSILRNESFRWIPWVGSALMAWAFVAMGIQVWRGGGFHFRLVPGSATAGLYRRFGRIPFALGALSAFLPCGWLQGFLLGAAATQSAARGAVFMLVFWTGTLPALGALPWVAQLVLRPLTARSPKVVGFLLILAGVLGAGQKVSTLLAAQPTPSHCQMMSEESEAEGD